MTATVAEIATLVHGYTMADIDRCARVAVSKHTRSASLDREDREASAWHAIVVELYTCEEPPSFYDLLRTAWAALDQDITDARHHYGWGADGDGNAPKFNRYWLPVKYERSDGFSDRICEAVALRDSLGVLTGDQYEAIATLAAYDNAAGDAAAALGLKYHGFMYRVYSAREKIKAVWFGDETPVASKKTGDTCRVGHARAEHGKLRPDGMWECRRCKRNADRRRNAGNRTASDLA